MRLADLVRRAHAIALREETLADDLADHLGDAGRARVAQYRGHHDVALVAHLVAEVVQHVGHTPRRRITLLGRCWRR